MDLYNQAVQLCKDAGYETAGIIKNWVKATDAQFLGSGYFASVYADGDDHVFKVGCWAIDGWPVYANWCMEQSNNPHLPEITGLHIFPDGTYLASIKRYRDTYEYRLSGICGEVPSRYGSEQLPLINIILAFNAVGFYYVLGTGYIPCEYESFEIFEQAIHDHIDEEVRKSGMFPYWQVVDAKEARPFVKTLYEIWEHFKETYAFDLHDLNYMLDSNNNIVITDPIAGLK